MELIFNEKINCFGQKKCCVSVRYDHDYENIATINLGKTWKEVRAKFPIIDSLFPKINQCKKMKKNKLVVNFDNLNNIRNIEMYSSKHLVF